MYLHVYCKLWVIIICLAGYWNLIISTFYSTADMKISFKMFHFALMQHVICKKISDQSF